MTSPFHTTRRGFLAGSVALGGTALLSSCVTGGEQPTAGSTAGGGTGSSGAITLQSMHSDPAPKAGMERLVEEYPGEITMNSVAHEQFRAQLSSWLTSSNPPDVFTWFAGSVSARFADAGYLLDLSDVWENGPPAQYAPALKDLSTDSSGQQFFIPTSYSFWGVFYFKSKFEEWGVSVPETWDDLLSLCETLKSQGVDPLANGIGSTPWMASGWFDILNLRVNGADFHRALLNGEHSFDSAEVRETMERYGELVPFFDPNMFSYAWQDAVTPFAQGRTAMYNCGGFLTQNFPGDDDLDFFSVPILDSSVPRAEETPTDGYFAAAQSGNPEGAKEFLTWMSTGEAQSAYLEASQAGDLPTSPEVSQDQFSPILQKVRDMIAEADQVTQFFNRDSSDALQTTADTALTKFLASPGDLDSILVEWQDAAERVWEA